MSRTYILCWGILNEILVLATIALVYLYAQSVLGATAACMVAYYIIWKICPFPGIKINGVTDVNLLLQYLLANAGAGTMVCQELQRYIS